MNRCSTCGREIRQTPDWLAQSSGRHWQHVERIVFDHFAELAPPETSIDPLDGFTLGYDRGYIGIGLHCATCTDQTGDIGMSESEAIAEIDDGTPLADVIELARTHHQRHEEQ